VSDTPRTNYDSVKDYFDSFLKMKPQGTRDQDFDFAQPITSASHNRQTTHLFISRLGKIIEGKINIGDGWASDAGIYEVGSDVLVALKMI
jgi:hypothetical protein